MTEQLCRCGKPTAGAELCADCARTLAYAIANVAGHYVDLSTVAAKATRYGGLASKGAIGKAQPLVVDMRFVSGPPQDTGARATLAPLTQLRWDAWNTVVAWCRTVMEEQSQVLGPWCEGTCLHVSCSVARLRRWPTNTVTSMCLYLDKQHRWIEGRDWSSAMLDEMLDLERRLTRAVNRPPDRWYAGKCSATVLDPDDPKALCRVDLYAREDRGWIDCPGCGARHDVSERREFLLAEARTYVVTATQAAGALISWTDYDGSQTKLVDRIRKWRDRHLFLLGDIQDLLVGHAQDQQAQQLTG
jgi:hypothetical protein